MMTEPENFTTVTLTPDELVMMIECVSSRAIFYDGLLDDAPDDFVREQFEDRRRECDHLLDLLNGEDD